LILRKKKVLTKQVANQPKIRNEPAKSENIYEMKFNHSKRKKKKKKRRTGKRRKKENKKRKKAEKTR